MRIPTLVCLLSLIAVLGVSASASSSPLRANNTCREAVQGRIAWNYDGDKRWSEANVAELCGSGDSVEPARCFEKVMHGGIDWGGSTRWRWQNALALCKSTRDADGTIACFQSELTGGSGWSAAIARCDGPAPSPPPGPRPTPTPTPTPTEAGGLERERPDVDLSLLATVRPSPADDRTRDAVRAAGRPIARPGVRPHADVRVTNEDGWYDVLVDTRSGGTYGICSDACFETDGCQAFVTGGPRNRPGGFCGLVAGTPSRRYDRAWVESSRGYASYLLGGVGDIDALDMVGSRTVALAMVLTSSQNATMQELIDSDDTISTGARGLAQCAERCVENEACAVFASNPGEKECLTFKDSGARTPLSRLPIHRGGAILGYMARFDTRPPDRQKFFRMFEPRTGLGLFSMAAVATLRGHRASYADHVEGLSAAMHTPTDGIWVGEEPPVAAARASDVVNELTNQALGDVFESDSTVAHYLPFQETIWQSTTEPGTYYYAPRAYWLDWSPSDGRLGGSQFFNAAGTLGDGRDVRMQIRLSGSYEPRELDTLRELVQAFIAKNRLRPLTELKRFPLEGAPELDMSAGLSGFTGSIETHSNAADLVAPIDLVFNVNDLSAQSLVENFVSPEGQPINGEIRFNSSKIAGGGVVVPVTLDPRNPGTYGGALLEGDVWVNRTPLTTRVNRVHALVIETERARILTWDVDSSAVSPGHGLLFETGESFPESLLEAASRLWVELELDRECRECVAEAMGVGAVTTEARSRVEFVMPPSLVERLGAEEVEIAFKSSYLRPDGDRERLAPPIVLTVAEPSASSPELFLPGDAQLAMGLESYSYRARLFTSDDRELCTGWVRSGEPRVRLGASSFSEDACE